MADRQSQSSASKASSAASSASSVAGEGLTQQAFPAIFGIDGPWPSKVVHLGIAVDFLQLFGMLLTHAWPWGEVMRFLSVPVYFITLPFWDAHYPRHVDFEPFLGFFFAVVAAVLLMLFLFALQIRAHSTHSEKIGTGILRVLFASLGGALFQPALHAILAVAVCNPDTSVRNASGDRTLAAFSDTACYGSGLPLLVFVLGLLCFVIIVCVRFAATCMMFDDTPLSQHPKARGSNFVDMTGLVVRLVLVVLHHVLIPLHMQQVFAAVFALAALLQLVLHVRDLPYLEPSLNRLHCAGFAALLFTSAQLALALSILDDGETWAYDVVIWVVGSSAFAVLGALAADLRVSGLCMQALAMAQEGLPLPGAAPRFPSHLPKEERVKYREMELVLTAQSRHIVEQGDVGARFERFKDEIAVMQPYVVAVYRPSDVELATRFLRHFAFLLRTDPPSRMVAFALRIYTKGIAKFSFDPNTMLHFAHFLSVYVPSHVSEAMAIIATIDKADVTIDVTVTYRAARRIAELMGTMLIQDASQKKAFMNAQRMHREALLHMNTFWTHLLDDHTDVAQLAVLAKTITDRREEGLTLFQRVVTEQADQSVLVRYAQFLEQVLMDADGATQVREYIVDQVEKSQMQRDTATAAAVGNAALLVQRRAQSSGAQASSTLSDLRAALTVLFLGSVAVVLGLIAFGVFFGLRSITTLDNVYDAGSVRRLSQHAAYIVETIADAAASPASAGNITALQLQLGQLTDEFRAKHYDLTVGKYKPAYDPLRWLVTVGLREVRLEDGGHGVASLWAMGTLFTSALERIVRAPDPVTLPQQFAAELSFVRENALPRIGVAFNESLELLIDKAVEETGIGVGVLVALFVTAVIICAVYYGVLIYNFGLINSSKLSTLSLFTLIPKAAVEKLRKESRQLIDTFDAPDAALEQKLLERGVAPDQTERLAELDGADAAPAPDSPEKKPSVKKASGAGFNAVVQNLRRAEGKMLRHGVASQEQEEDQVFDGDDLFGEQEWTTYDTAKRETVAADTEEAVADEHPSEDEEEGEEGAEAAFQNKASGGSGATRKSQSATMVSLLGALFCCGLTLALAFVLRSQATAAVDEGDKFVKEFHALHDTYVARLEVVDALQRFVADASDNAAFTTLSERLPASSGAALVHVATATKDRGLATAVYRSNDAWREINVLGRIAVALACRAGNTSRPQTPDTTASTSGLRVPAGAVSACSKEGDTLITATQWDVATDPLLQSIASKLGGCTLQLTNSTHDLATLSGPSLLGQALLLVFTQPFEDIMKAALLPLDEALRDVSRRTPAITDKRDAATGLAATTLAVAALSGVTLFAFAVSSWGNVPLLLLIGLTAGLMLGVIPCSAVVLAEVGDAYDTHHRHFTLGDNLNATLSDDFALRRYLREAVIADSVPSAAASDALLRALPAETALLRLASAVDVKYLAHVAAAMRALHRHQHLGSVALTLAQNQTLSTATSRTTQWDFTAEVDHARTQLQYPTQQFYTTRAADTALGPDAKKLLAWHLAAGPWEHGIEAQFTTAVQHVASTFATELEETIADKRSNMRRWGLAGIVVSGVAVALSFINTIVTVLTMISAADGNAEDAAAPAEADSDGDGGNLFDVLAQRSRVSLVALALLFAGVFVLGTVAFVGLGAAAEDINTASLREYGVAQSFAIAQDLRPGSVSSRKELAARLSGIEWATEAFYFGEKLAKSGYRAFGRWKDVDDALFGPSAYSEQEFTCAAGAPINDTATMALASGADIATRYWRVEAAELARLTDPAAFDARLAAMRADAPRVLSALARTTELARDDSQSRVRLMQIVFCSVAGVIAVVVVVLFFFVFRPMLGQLLHEEEGTKLMLRMIPEDVRQTVPAIAEYLRRGVILQDTKLQEINDAMTEMSTIPTIAIDFHGRILRFSRAAEDTFQYRRDDVLGKNIKILMPENVAIEHDGYLENYYRTGVKKVIGTPRRVRAMRADGTVFPAEIVVREVKTGRTTTFVGTIRNIVLDIEFERTIALSKAVSEVAPVPIVVINAVGTIQRFNSTAEQTFKCDARDVVGQNVTRLMTARDAERHDQYLERYAQTKEKRVINKRRPVRCKRRTGEVFVAMLSIVELVQEGGTLFIGYIEDHTKQLNVEVATTLNEAIAATAPVPLVAITTQGIVEQWNLAAARIFRTQPSEMLGRNIKTVMPESIAAKHDGFLAAYLRTGRKSMLDRVTQAKGRRASDMGGFEHFPLLVAVKEIVRQGKPNYYVAYLQDRTTQAELAVQYKIASAVIGMSITPIILISSLGRVQAFSRAASALFGYTAEEVVGEKVDKLMPKEFAVKHDSYLERYMTTRVKTIVDTTRHVPALLKSGAVVQVELNVREVINGDESIFVGYLRSVEEDIRMRRENAINNAVAQLSTVPMIVIDHMGTVLACSDSACEKFSYPREELVGQNIKMLMPIDVAMKHDSYLARYRDSLEANGVEATRQASTILHRERRVVAKTRDEQTFHADVHVRDLHIDGTPPVFVGTVRDLTQDLEKDAQLTVGNTIVETSTIPFIAMDRFGTVSIFSAAAERDFGFSREEVIGKNIKMLMQEDIAKNHDGYLRAYAKTGIKKVIDSRRVVQGRHKDGTVLPVEITVKELFHKDVAGNEVNEFIGFLRNLRQEYILKQANQINQVASSLSTVPIVMIDERGMIGDFNSSAEETFGYAASEVLQRNIKMLMPESIAKQHDGYLQRYRQTGEKHIIGSTRVVQGRRKNGATFPCEVSVREVVKEGQARQFLGYVRDVTLQQEVALQAEINSTIVHLSPTPLIVMDKHGTVSTFSRTAEDLFGFASREVINENIKMLMPEEVASHHDEYLAAYAKTGEKHVVGTTRRVRGRRKDGTLFPADITVRELTDQEGRPMFIGYITDRTADAIFEAQVAFAAAIGKMSPLPIITIDHVGVITSFSVAAEEVFGYTAAEAVGQNVTIIQTADVAVKHDDYLARYLRTGKKFVLDAERRVTGQRKDGTTFPCSINVKEVRTDPDKPPTFVAYARNVEQELAVAEASREGTATMQVSPSPIIVMSTKGIVTFANSATETVFGYPLSAVVGKNIKMLMPDSIAKHHDMYLSRYLETGVKSVIGSTRRATAQRQDGTVFPMEIMVREVAVDGLDTQYIGCVTDMTDTVRKVEQNMISEAVTELSGNAIIVIDPVGTVLKISRETEDLVKYSAAEVVGKNIKMLMPEEIARNHDEYLSRYRQTGVKSVIGTTRVLSARDKSGTVFPVELGVREVETELGVVYVGFLRDLRSSFNVGTSAEVNEMMVELALQAIITITPIGTVRTVNDPALDMFGVTREEVVGQNIKMLMPESIANEHDGYLEAYAKTGVKHVIDTTRRAVGLNTKTGKPFPVEISVREIDDTARKERYFLGYVRNIERDLQLDVAQRTNAAAMHLSKHGIVIIDRQGTILQFSRAAELLFGADQQQVVGQNVKILMQDHVAARHDEFLSNYRRTGKKTVVDSTKDVIGKHLRTGASFPLALRVKELSFSTTGLENIYVGFCEGVAEPTVDAGALGGF